MIRNFLKKGNPIFWDVVFQRQFGEFCQLISEDPSLVRSTKGEGVDLLHYLSTVCEDSYDFVVKVMEIDPGAYTRDKKGQTPLHLSCWYNCINISKFYINWGVDVVCEDKLGERPIHKYCGSSNFREDDLGMIADMLIKNDHSNVDCSNKFGVQPVHKCASSGNVRALDVVTRYGANVNAVDSQGRVPAHYAAFQMQHPDDCPSVEVVKHLFNSGADFRVQDKVGISPLEMATSYPKMRFGAISNSCQDKVVEEIEHILGLY